MDFLKSLVRSSSEGTESFDLVVTWPGDRPTWLTDEELTAGPLRAATARIEALSSDPKEVSSELGEHLEFLIDASRQQLKRTFAAQDAFEAALKLERLARAGELNGVEEGFAVLAAEVERLRTALESLSAAPAPVPGIRLGNGSKRA